MDKLTEYRTKLSWIKQLLSVNEHKELTKVWEKYSMMRKLIQSVEEDLNKIEILETYTEKVKVTQYKVKLKKVAKELARMTKEANGL